MAGNRRRDATKRAYGRGPRRAKSPTSTSFFRAQIRRACGAQSGSGAPGGKAEPWPAFCPSDLPVKKASDAELKVITEAAIDELPPDFRVVFAAYDAKGFPRASQSTRLFA